MRKAIHKSKGLAAVEMTIALPVILLLLFIIIDFGKVMFEIITTTSSARTAAGYGAQSTMLTSDFDGMKNVALADASDLTLNTANPTAVEVSTRQFCRCAGSTDEVSCWSSCPTNLEVYVEVTTNRTFETVSNFPLLPNSVSITRVATMRAQ